MIFTDFLVMENIDVIKNQEFELDGEQHHVDLSSAEPVDLSDYDPTVPTQTPLWGEAYHICMARLA